jgi:hypothetical protein
LIGRSAVCVIEVCRHQELLSRIVVSMTVRNRSSCGHSYQTTDLKFVKSD